MQVPAAAEVNDALGRVFARAEFAEHRVPALVRFVRDLWRAVREWISGIIGRIVPEHAGDIGTFLVIALLVAAAAWTLMHLIDAAAGSAASASRRPNAGVVADERTAAWWEAAARAAAGEARYRDAALAIYTAAVLRLEEKGVLRYHPAKTPGDYRREVRSDPVMRGMFEPFVRELLPVAFGSQQPDAGTFEALRVRAAELGVRA